MRGGRDRPHARIAIMMWSQGGRVPHHTKTGWFADTPIVHIIEPDYVLRVIDGDTIRLVQRPIAHHRDVKIAIPTRRKMPGRATECVGWSIPRRHVYGCFD